MLAKLSGSLPRDDDRWSYEMKWDGIRAMGYIQGGQFRIMTRNQIDVTKRYPELQPLGDQLTGRTAILDGEIVGFDDDGRPSFEALQQRMGLEGGRRVPSRPDVAVAYMVFDLLYLEDASLLQQPYETRRARLEGLHLEADHWATPPSTIGGGEAMLQASREQGYEGVIAKRLGNVTSQGSALAHGPSSRISGARSL